MDDNIVVLTQEIADDAIVCTIKHEKQTNSSNEWISEASKDEQTKTFNMQEYLSSCEEKTMNFSSWHPDLDETIFIEEIVITENAEYPEGFAKLNIPIFTKCQNCEMNFPTKYQYQRHQCNLMSEISSNDKNKLLSIENQAEEESTTNFECHTCGERFSNTSDLSSHEKNHDANETNNINCTFCGKKFVSQNRLKIHMENNCKKAENISKFYKSDLTVWKCKKCYEIFASIEVANNHVVHCQEEFIPNDKENINNNITDDHNKNMMSYEIIELIEKISTELLLQCEFCNKTFADKKFLVMHQRKHTTIKNYECITCHQIFDSYCNASLHWLKRCSSEYSNSFYLPKRFYCEFCDRTFKSHQLLYSHKIKTNHYIPKVHDNESLNQFKIVPSQSKNGNKNDVNKLIESLLKSLDVPMDTDLIRNDNDFNNDKVAAKATNVCDIVIKKEPNESDNNSIYYYLEPCDEPMPLKKKQKPSTSQRKPRKNNKRYNRNNILEPGYKFQCERCIKVFDTVQDMSTHRDNEHAVIYQCEACGKVEETSKALTNHTRTHSNLKPHVCEICGRGYSQTSHLWQHMRFHQGIKPFACPQEGCNARYTIRPDLKDHIRKVHTRERPFKCLVCNRSFLTGSVFYQHRLIHTNDRRYGCEICQKRFFRADALNNHKRIHTNERPFQCNVCGREFRQKGDKNKHVRTQHPDYHTIFA